MLAVLILAASHLYAPAIHPRYPIERVSFDLDGLPLRATFPKGITQPLPVFVFSHGMYGSRDGYGPLVDAVAGNGYFVVQMSHADSASRMSAEDKAAFLRNPNVDQTQNWRERPGEVSRCIDAIDTIAQRARVKVDSSRIAVGGHSYGAWTTQCLAGMPLTVGTQSISFLDERPRAYVVLSPHGPGKTITREGLGKMRSPMLMVTGSQDSSPRGETPEWRRRAFGASAPGDRILVWIDGATHNFGGLTGDRSAFARRFMERAGASVSQNPAHVAIAKSAVVAFLDAYVKQDPSARSYWKERKLARDKSVQIESK